MLALPSNLNNQKVRKITEPATLILASILSNTCIKKCTVTCNWCGIFHFKYIHSRKRGTKRRKRDGKKQSGKEGERKKERKRKGKKKGGGGE